MIPGKPMVTKFAILVVFRIPIKKRKASRYKIVKGRRMLLGMKIDLMRMMITKYGRDFSFLISNKRKQKNKDKSTRRV
jgi:hypothetical protein